MTPYRQNTTFLAVRGIVTGAATASVIALAAAIQPGLYLGGYLVIVGTAAALGALVGGLAAIPAWLLTYALPLRAAETWWFAIIFGAASGAAATWVGLRVLGLPPVVEIVLVILLGVAVAVFTAFTIVSARRRRAEQEASSASPELLV